MKRASAKAYQKVLRESTLNPKILKAKYAVRGAIVQKADEMAKAGASIVACNIGNPHALLQKPITFFRQVLALVTYPELLETKQADELFPSDAIARARKYLKRMPGGSGAYSNSKGVDVVREEVAQFLKDRDGGKYETDVEDIFLTDGASPGVKMALSMLIRKPSDGILIPIPQYPLYSASIALKGGTQVGYFLDEQNNWGMDMKHVEEQLEAAKKDNIDVRALVVINPGNPTGQCMEEKDMQAVVEFCEANNLVLMADEVYQTNIYDPEVNWTSFRKVVHDMESPLELFSFHSVSKGFVGECGRRGGFLDIVNVGDDVRDQMYKLASVSLCSNVDGQLTTGLMCQPPKKGDPSYELYEKESTAILSALARKCKKLAAALNGMMGVSVVQGHSLYLFPSIKMTDKAIAYAKEKGQTPDLTYCMELLEHSGLCVVPASGFGQKDGRYGFRTTILPREEDIDDVVAGMKKFHEQWLERFGS